MAANESSGWVLVIEGLRQDIRQLYEKVEELEGKVEALSHNLHTHRLTGNGGDSNEQPARRFLGLTGKDALLVILAAAAGSNILTILDVV